MKVQDYYNDMVLGQKWAIQVETEITHDTEEPFTDVCVDTLHYSVPITKQCPYFNDSVSYFRVVHDEIVLCIRRTDFV